MENHHAINGKTSTISMTMFNSFLYVYQRVFTTLQMDKILQMVMPLCERFIAIGWC
jgi:hypothetical protein